ncbi:MAG TPA: hypothetical protein VFE06_15065 [Acidobacteriaceae bacterium]|nr:hypothetical protein [Acidobacteriaceae bacterium]
MKPIVDSLLFPPAPVLFFRLCSFCDQGLRLLSLDSPAYPALAEDGDLLADYLAGGFHPLPFPRENLRISHRQPGVGDGLVQQPSQDIAAGLVGQSAMLFRSPFQSAQFPGPGLQIQSGQLFEKLPDMQHTHKALLHGFRPAA